MFVDVERIIDASAASTCPTHRAKRRTDLDRIFVARPDLMMAFNTYLVAHKHLHALAERETIREDLRALGDEYSLRKEAAGGEIRQLVALKRTFDQMLDLARDRFRAAEKLRRSLEQDAVPDAPEPPGLGDAREHQAVPAGVPSEHHDCSTSSASTSSTAELFL